MLCLPSLSVIVIFWRMGVFIAFVLLRVLSAQPNFTTWEPVLKECIVPRSMLHKEAESGRKQ